MKRLIRNKKDKVYRTGGDEFCILLESTIDISISIANRLSNELIAAGINAATGVYMSDQKEEIIEAFRKADERMLSKKKAQKHLHNSLIHPSHLISTRKTKTNEEIEMIAQISRSGSGSASCYIATRATCYLPDNIRTAGKPDVHDLSL